MIRRLCMFWALAVLPAATCGSDPAPCGLRLCDIREADCQSMAAAAAACLRGVDPVTVPVTVVPRDEFIAQAAATPLTPEQEEAFGRWNAGLAALHLAPADDTPAANSAASASQLGGVYSFTDKRITIVDDGQPLDSLGWVAVLVHENEHAIQDARFGLADLSTKYAIDLDRALAFGSIFEGDATFIGDLASAGLFGLQTGGIPWQSVFQNWQAGARNAARYSSRPVSLAWSQFRYPFGTGYVKGAFDAGDWTGVDGLFTAPPGGTREVMAGFGASEPAGGPWAVDLGDDAVPILGDGYDYVGTDRMGTWLFEAFLRRLGDRSYVSDYTAPTDLPPLLRGDALSIFHDRATGGAVAVWRLRLSITSSSYAASSSYNLDSALRALPAARADGWTDDFIVVAASDEATLAAVPFVTPYQAIPSTAASAPPTFSRNWGCALTAR